eukprot:40834-Rhodomonas_salina.2
MHANKRGLAQHLGSPAGTCAVSTNRCNVGGDNSDGSMMAWVQAYENAKRILVSHREKLDKLAQELIDKETLTGDQ